MSCRGVAMRVFFSLAKFQYVICDRKGVYKNGFLIYFGGSNCLVDIFRTVCCTLDPVLVIYYFM